ncbi:MAG: UDP-N-acetylglucosamine 2-epimerase (non-hydrolyzing) [Rhizobacter sp.]|nr:UDP-N-acetylglucosamine 2-epimerase (non-hydrolyzing) [Rhizobacter sp.]
MRIATVIGTRPEAIKLAPLILAAREHPDRFEVRIVRTGQHRELVDELLTEFGLRADFDLKVMRPDQDLAHVLSASVRGLSDLIARERPDWVIVQGDTTTTLAGALAAFYNRARIGHVEAGLRTGDRRSPFPEEANRTLTTHLADLHFAPTERARQNLLREGIDSAAIVVTGNTVVDALVRTQGLAPLKRSGDSNGTASPYFLVTTHRRENHGEALLRICDAVRELLELHPHTQAWIPMHPNPRVRAVLTHELGGNRRALLTDPLSYTAFVRALEGAALVLTDSGGVQEECAALGKPVLVMREHTERPEAIEAGVAKVVGTGAHAIVDEASRLLRDAESSTAAAARSTNAFGDGRAAERILAALRDQRSG